MAPSLLGCACHFVGMEVSEGSPIAISVRVIQFTTDFMPMIRGYVDNDRGSVVKFIVVGPTGASMFLYNIYRILCSNSVLAMQLKDFGGRR